MTKNELNDAYFDWMYQLVCGNRPRSRKRSYQNLLHQLHDIDFEYFIAMDGNRAEDGEDLRYRFGYELGHPDAMIAAHLDDRPCSVLEMLVALAIRCEEHIMDDPEIGNRTGTWFWDMITNLELSDMNDENYDVKYVDDVIQRFLSREYGRHGEGGLFTIEHCMRDLRTVEIWYQMCWYLDKFV